MKNNNNKNKMILKRTRQIVALVCFIVATALFLDFTGTIHGWLGWMAQMQLVPALLAVNVCAIALLVVLTIVTGRIYCSVICPLGVMQDIVSRIATKRKKNRFTFSPAISWLRYAALAVFVLAFVAGLHSIVALLDPYGAYGRMASNLLAPIYQWGNNALAWMAERVDSYAFYSTEVWMKSVATFAIAAATFVAIAVLAWRNGRTYCNTVCPAGTLLGLIARFSIFKPVIDTEKCNGCRLCARNCKASCINEKEHAIDYSRCVACMNCISVCRQKAITYSIPKKIKGETEEGDKGLSRRKALTLVAGIGLGSLAKAQQQLVNADGGLADIIDRKEPERMTSIVPAGAKGPKNFAAHCTGCQLCVSVCTTQVLRPSEGWSTMMQPLMSFERGYCRTDCTKCSEVCPTGAIKRVTMEEKSSIQIGRAIWNPELCVVNADKQPCDNCFRHCPSAAITMIDNPDAPPVANMPMRFGPPPKPLKIPVVNIELCIGCGACESLCPSRPLSAIHVEGLLLHHTI